MYANETELINAFEENLNDLYGPVEICGLKYEAASALKAIDPQAYREALLDYANSLAAEGELPEKWEDWEL